MNASDFTIAVTDAKKKPVLDGLGNPVDANLWFNITDNGDGSFSIGFDMGAWANGVIKPEYKYAIILPKGTPAIGGNPATGTIIGDGALFKDAAKAFTVARGSIKLAKTPAAVTLYKASPHSSAIVTITANGAPLPESARVAIAGTPQQVQNTPYDILPLGGGQYAIIFKQYVPAAKGNTIKLNVYLEGNYLPVGTLVSGVPTTADTPGAKPNGSVPVKVNIR